MGIKGLFKVISDNAPAAVRVTDWKALAGRKVAIDASMSLYQFLIAVRSQDGMQLSTEDGETTSHLIGMFYRTLRMVDNGLKPVYVFDGAPPELKSEELSKRLSAREKAEAERDVHKEAGNVEEMTRFEKRLVRVSREQNAEAKRLLQLMGIPVVDAPSEAEAQCSALAAASKVYAAGSEDMDTLTFGAPIMLRHLTAGDQKKQPITEIDLARALELMGLSKPEFVDLCILLGCDYCDPIRGMGPSTAYKMVQEHRTIEAIAEALKQKGGKVQVPEDWPYVAVRKLFLEPETQDPAEITLKWSEPDIDGLVEFLVKEKGFSEERVRSGAAKLTKGSTAAPQGRLTDFFSVKKRPTDAKDAKAAPPAKKKAKGK